MLELKSEIKYFRENTPDTLKSPCNIQIVFTVTTDNAYTIKTVRQITLKGD